MFESWNYFYFKKNIVLLFISAIGTVHKYLNKGLEETSKACAVDDAPEDVTEVLAYLKAVHALKHAQTEQEACGLIEKYHLSLEVVPTQFRKLPEVIIAFSFTLKQFSR